MTDKLGYTKPLHILAFDQRSSFTQKMLGIEAAPTPEQRKMIAGFKLLIYRAFERGLEKGVPAQEAGLLVDEEFGDEILRDARQKGYTMLLPTEKSAQAELNFEYGEEFAEHIEKYRPTFVKVLLRYNPEGNKAINERQVQKLKTLSDFSHSHGYKFLIEALISPTEEQLAKSGTDTKRFDLEQRPGLEVEMMRQIQAGGVEPDVWKIEGLEKPEEYRALAEQARANGRDNAGVIVLGRHASDEQVRTWLSAGAGTPGVIGFAIGRTIFWEPILGVKEGRISADEAVEAMAEKYWQFYKFFKESAKV
ncbi:MAG: DUF2090 domain-containing protein [Patescibacteria group bacterium]|nr:DUF2090 domain-containing protein [Patescibacteria group bacterium]